MTNKPYGTLYTGTGNDLVKRVYEHKTKKFPNSFTARYGVDQLVYFEQYEEPATAIAREKEIKKWPRARKICLIEKFNPTWRDLYYDFLG